jgi:hypothetical protein
MRVVEEFETEGYYFIIEQDDTCWKVMDKKEVVEKVRTALRNCGNNRKKKSGKRKAEAITQSKASEKGNSSPENIEERQINEENDDVSNNDDETNDVDTNENNQ